MQNYLALKKKYLSYYQFKIMTLFYLKCINYKAMEKTFMWNLCDHKC